MVSKTHDGFMLARGLTRDERNNSKQAKSISAELKHLPAGDLLQTTIVYAKCIISRQIPDTSSNGFTDITLFTDKHNGKSLPFP